MSAEVFYDESPGQLNPAKPQVFVPGTGQETAKYIVDPGFVRYDERQRKIVSSPGQLGTVRPYLKNGAKVFVWPVGAEGFRRSGSATLALHHYLGEDFVDAQVIHYNESRIELNGVFPGRRARFALVELEKVMTTPPPSVGMTLYMPGVFQSEQRVVMENYDFSHDADDRTDSIPYTVTFVRTGTGKQVANPKGRLPQPNGTVQKFMTVARGLQTFRAIAQRYLGSADKWGTIWDLNGDNLLSQIHFNVPYHTFATYRWPLGTRIRYK